MPPHNTDYTCTNCTNEKHRRNNMPNGIILMTFKFMEIAYIFLIFLTQEMGKQYRDTTSDYKKYKEMGILNRKYSKFLKN